MSQQNIQAVQNAYNHFKSGDIKGLLETLSEDVEWILPEIKNLPFSGRRAGREQVGQFFASVAELQDVLQFEPREFIADKDKVVSLGHYRWRAKSTDKIFESDFAHVFTIQNGMVVRFQEFTDTGAAASAHSK